MTRFHTLLDASSGNASRVAFTAAEEAERDGFDAAILTTLQQANLSTGIAAAAKAQASQTLIAFAATPAPDLPAIVAAIRALAALNS